MAITRKLTRTLGSSDRPFNGETHPYQVLYQTLSLQFGMDGTLFLARVHSPPRGIAAVTTSTMWRTCTPVRGYSSMTTAATVAAPAVSRREFHTMLTNFYIFECPPDPVFSRRHSNGRHACQPLSGLTRWKIEVISTRIASCDLGGRHASGFGDWPKGNFVGVGRSIDKWGAPEVKRRCLSDVHGSRGIQSLWIEPDERNPEILTVETVGMKDRNHKGDTK